MKQAVRQFLKALPPADRRLVAALRRLISQLAPEAEETVVWGCLSYHNPRIGGRVKGAVCQIVAKRGVRLDFIHGVCLPDPARLLRGDGVSKRFTVIESPTDIRRPELCDLIEAARCIPAGVFE